MPKSLFRHLEGEDPATRELELAVAVAKRKARFLALIDNLIQRLEDVPRMDIRDYTNACSLIDKVLSREKDDEPNRGSAVREYAPEFQKAYGAGRRAADTGPAEEPDRAADGGEPPDSDWEHNDPRA